LGYDTPDVYYQPEKFDLTPIGEIEWSSGSYEFDLTVVWRHEDGRLFYANDSGCSCPSPFENYTSLDDLTEITDVSEFQDALNDTSEHNYDGNRNAEVADLMSRIAEAL
jgi:hypothetical protein